MLAVAPSRGVKTPPNPYEPPAARVSREDSGFGAELPWLSQVALGGAWVWSLLALAALFVVVFLVTLLALYLPIFRLGAVV